MAERFPYEDIVDLPHQYQGNIHSLQWQTVLRGLLPLQPSPDMKKWYWKKLV